MSYKQILFLSFILSFNVHAVSVDEYLHQQLDFFGVKKYESLPVNNSDEYQSKINLGRKLFIDTNLSGNRNISCLTCHNPAKGLSDGHGLSQTEDGKGVLKRNSSSLFNIGDKFNTFMFWDGRVHYTPSKKTFETPEAALNGV
ncbi:MAG: cytochrome-c peroxidase, partial [Bacteriovorax sp.]|nr:cytochrome-c peroxidase [Bacteriovorax sp.]